MFKTAVAYTKFFFKFSWAFSKYLYYGLKQRIRSLFKGTMGFVKFLKSLIQWPFEAWTFASIELRT